MAHLLITDDAVTIEMSRGEKPGLVISSVYNGYWYWGRPSPAQLRADWDITAPGQRDAWERGDKRAFWPYGLSLREVFSADPSEG
jgi:hypothetical protein